jgi:hypothetical protein
MKIRCPACGGCGFVEPHVLALTPLQERLFTAIRDSRHGIGAHRLANIFR